MVHWVTFDPQKKSRLLITVFIGIVILSIGVSFFRFFILRDYAIQSQIECDPYVESCFIYVCDPNAEECTGDPIQDTSYYKLIDRNARNIPLCDPNNEGCDPLTCLEGEEECYVTFCNAESAEQEATECTDPEQFSKDYPQPLEPSDLEE